MKMRANDVDASICGAFFYAYPRCMGVLSHTGNEEHQANAEKVYKSMKTLCECGKDNEQAAAAGFRMFNFKEKMADLKDAVLGVKDDMEALGKDTLGRLTNPKKK